MRAIVFDLSIPKFIVARGLSVATRRTPLAGLGRRLLFGPGACVQLRDVTPPTPHDAQWAALTPSLVGLCGSDVATVALELSPAMSAVSTSPCILGHEILARITTPPAAQTDATGRKLSEGTRVVVEPFASCTVRGLPDDLCCPSCTSGYPSTCERAGLGPRKGLMTGAAVDFPGGFAERTIAHGSQLWVVDGRIARDEVAALVEPLAVAVQAVSTHAPREGRALVLGGGPIGLAVAWALSRLAPDVEVTLVSRAEHQAAHARRLGVSRTIIPPPGVDPIEPLALAAGSPVLRPPLSRPYLTGGFDAVFECSGSTQGIDDALRTTRPRGTLVMVGCQGIVPMIDLTFIWLRELRVAGTLAYGWCKDPDGARRRTFDLTIDLMADDVERLAPLVTHVLPLTQFGDALDLAMSRKTSKCVKVLLRPA